ncbi:carboxypeptidase-like regulatory domain-containing protein [Acidobacterium sp. S8]|uniref:carboxypeptidase-like regulatory domain-containing protein n=1 Tax=Acidobacterium sp. S8 TaxID=1641854 RepID=UPI00131ACE04|nr:carboxypeptidase regulatory-like domain-containing protein [Acidobacterium sp. S8]
MLIRWRLFIFLSLGLLLAPLAQAQSDNASISGTITDSAGAVLPRATVTIRNEATTEVRSATSNDGGFYTVTNLAPGTYTVRIEAQGFESYVQSHAHLDPSIGLRIDANLRIGSSATTVNVVANANVVQTQTAAVGQLVTQQQVQAIQLNGRNPMYLAQLEPGVRRSSSISNFNFGLDNGININGSNSRENGMTFDGAPMVRSRGNGTSIGVADTDSTSEMQVLTAAYPAEYGRASGGIIRIVPKSGTSDFHGAAFEYLRNSFLNANTWSRKLSTDPSIYGHPPAFRFNQFGWNFNGPVWIPGVHFNTNKNKLFFLAGQEWIRYRHVDTDTRKVPTALMRGGDFSELLNPSNIFYGKAIQLVNPTTGAPYPGNIIPPDQLSANGLALLNAYPAPNAANPTYNWIDAAIYPEDQRKDTLVVDYLPSDSHHIRFSLLNYNYDSVSPHYGNFNRTPQVWHRPNQVAVFHYTWTVSPTMVNEAYVSGSADHVRIGIDLSSGLYNRTNYGINYPYLFPGGDKEIPDKIPTIQIANFDTLDGGPYPSHSGGVVWDFADSLTKIIGNHTLKAGVLYERESQNDFDQINVSSTTPGATNNQNGFFTFTDTRGGNPSSNAGVGNTALGLFDTYGEIGVRAYTIFLANMYEYFVQDTWRAKPNLVIEYGLRHSIMQPYYARWGNLSVFSPATYDPSTAPTVDPTTGFVSGSNLYDGIVIPGSSFPSEAKGHVPDDILNGQYNNLFHGFDRGYNPTVWTNIQPRVGITYSLDSRTVIRAGAGRYFDRLGVSDSVHLGGNPPFQPSATVSYGAVNDPGGIGANNYPINMTSYAYHFPSPEAWSWTFTTEHEFSGLGVFTLGYVGRHGLHLQHLENINQLVAGTRQANPDIAKPDALRPFQGFSVIQQQTNDGISMYHGLQANLKRRVTHGLMFGVAYTWSKSTDTASDAGTNIPNYYDPKEFYGPSDYDTRHILVINYVWDLSFADHASNWAERNVFGRWQLSGTSQFQSGYPLSVSTGDDFAGVGPGSGNQLWTITGPVQMLKKSSPNNSNGNLWFTPGVFQQPAAGTFSARETRNQVYGPGFQSWNIAMQKAFSIIPAHENNRLIFKAEAFNFLNHPNLDNPNTTPTSNTFGKATAKGNTYASDRQMQFSLRYQF